MKDGVIWQRLLGASSREEYKSPCVSQLKQLPPALPVLSAVLYMAQLFLEKQGCHGNPVCFFVKYSSCCRELLSFWMQRLCFRPLTALRVLNADEKG